MMGNTSREKIYVLLCLKGECGKNWTQLAGMILFPYKPGSEYINLAVAAGSETDCTRFWRNRLQVTEITLLQI